MSFKKGKLIVKAPYLVTNWTINNFVKKNENWIRLQKEKQEKSLIDPEKIPEYKKNAKNYIVPRVNELAEKFGFDYNKIRITSASTRWGSCSSMRNLNFSYRLILIPKEVIDYVIIHELCHLRHMNHSKKFWTEVEKYMPTYKEKEKWLKKNAYLFH
jgi:predicted metal-dependent hydrolase